jgi:hypothetical protein
VHHPPALAVAERALFGLLFLAHGVTSVRDAGSTVGDPAGLARQIERGERPGPRTFGCGPFLDGDPPIWPTARVVRGAADAPDAIEALVSADRRCAMQRARRDCASSATFPIR